MTDPIVQAELDQYLSSSNQQSRTTHPEDRNDPDDLDSDNDSTTLHDEDPSNHADPSSSADQARARHYIPYRPRFNANTGPKGVIADAQAFEDAKAQRRQQLHRQVNDKQGGTGHSTSGVAVDQEKSHEDHDDEDNDDDDDDEFLREWRANRVFELRQQSAHSVSGVTNYYRHPRRSNRDDGPVANVNGAVVKDVTAQEYLDVVEGTAADVTVLVLIYDEQDSYDSPALFSSFSSLAHHHHQQQSQHQFITLRSSIAGPMKSLRVPAIIGYRAGEVVGMVQGLDHDNRDNNDDYEVDALANALRREELLL